ncbi:PREDICTED: cytochrome P450 CYP82D47-like [Nelumbo nucifera]|uniref:Cytochrome P450 CYP82D47-like n=2 Tax=Nelumbo nucifera TaxID=4432 RepID=A0A1U7ZXG8_NELNU|nr:PREDICTED: cytochrome P450 CYP82D47-like [Nelumbo nucifera]DAD35496.1 TPA_asm: hypothetical protein HUJ06_006136 [Nelumbo nucifera]
MNFQEATAVVFFGLVLVLAFISFNHLLPETNTKARQAPQPSGAWPIIGHLHLFRASELLHPKLGAMADKYGPAFMLRLGMRRALVVSSWDAAKQCFTTNDKVFSTRPRTVAIKHMGYNYALPGFAPYGPYWREMRKISTVELLSHRRLDMFKHIRTSEIDLSMKDLYTRWVKNGHGSPVLVEMKQWFSDLTMNIVTRMIAGKRYFGAANYTDFSEEEVQKCKKAITEFMHLVGIFVVSDALPFLGWLDLQGHERAMKRTAKQLDHMLESWLKEHRCKKRASEGIATADERDFMDVLLSILDDHQCIGYGTDTVVKATCLGLILGGSDTTSVTLTWALSLLLNNRQALKKAQDELDTKVGRDGLVEESDIRNLVYLQAIVKETLRLYPAAAVSAPREAMEDCTVAGFHIPAGTQLLVNIWKLQRDPSIWPHPCEFSPERFLTSHAADIDVRGQHFELLPFGSGRRACPGISFAIQVLHLTLARLIQGFDLGTPCCDAMVDMTQGIGLTNHKKTPLDVLLTPRLHPLLYGY